MFKLQVQLENNTGLGLFATYSLAKFFGVSERDL